MPQAASPKRLQACERAARPQNSSARKYGFAKGGAKGGVDVQPAASIDGVGTQVPSHTLHEKVG